MIDRRLGLALALAACMAGPSGAQTPPASPPPTAQVATKTFTVGYAELDKDPRYANEGAYAGIVFRTVGRPYPGAEVALAEARQVGRVTHTDYELKKVSGASAGAIADAIRALVTGSDVHFILADLPGPVLLEVSKAVASLPVTLLNVSAPDDDLRGADCQRNLVHTTPSQAMLSDALLQFLVSRKWRKIVALQGPAPADAAAVEALKRSAKKFGATLVDTRAFQLSNDPRSRDSSNIPLLTAGLDYDVLYVADESNQFGRYVPYQTSLPRPVVGSAGLVATAWSWPWDRDGAAQLQHRFEKAAFPRRMNGEDFSAWAAMKALSVSVLKARSTDPQAVRDLLLGPNMTLDTVKGLPGSFRTWDHQLREPLLLSTPDAVIGVAPLPEFLHQSDVLDTLGVDRPETACHLE